MKLNKLITGFVAVTILSLFFSCASTDDSVKEVVFDAEETEEAAQDESESEEQEITEDNTLLVTTDEASSYQVDAVAPAGRDNKKNYTGWIATSVRPVVKTVGNITIYTRPKKGTFSISILNQNEKSVPVLSTSNEYMTTSFYLKAGRKVVKLCDDYSVVTASKKTDNGIKLRYSIEKVGVVIVDFECFSSKEGEPEDSIKVTAAVVSQSKKKTDFQIKFLMDTVLGETDRHHFYTSEGLPVKNEVVYHSMDQEKWFVSKNAKASMQIIMAGGECTPVESVALANFATLDTKKWEADMTSFRSFDTVLSYNNSAVGIYWPKVSLQPEEEAKNVFYLSLAADEAVPGGAAYILAKDQAAQEAEAAVAAEEEGDAGAEEQTAVEEEMPVQNIEAVKEKLPEPKAEQTPAKEEPKTEPVNVAAVEETPEPKAPETKTPEVKAQEPKTEEPKGSTITDDMLTGDYIQKLLNRIEELEEGDPELNKREINELNAQLDAIITILNSKNQ